MQENGQRELHVEQNVLFPSKYAGRGDTVQAVIDSYLDFKSLLAKRGLITPGYYARLCRHLNDFAGVYGNWPLPALRNSLLQKWVLDHAQWTKGASRDDAVSSIVACFTWAEDDLLIDRCPFRKPKGVWEVPEPREAITSEQYSAIMHLARESNGISRRKRPGRTHLRLILWFMWETGCRTCEARAVGWRHIDWVKGAAFLTDFKTKKKVGGVRTIALTSRVMRVLRFLHAHRRGLHDHVFLNSRGRPWTSTGLGDLFRAYADLAGVPEAVSAYSLRHGFVADALERGEGEKQIADTIGQASTKYIAWYGKRAKRNVNYLRDVCTRTRCKNPGTNP